MEKNNTICGKIYSHEDSLGDSATREDAESWAEFLRSKLDEHYPGHEIEVIVGTGINQIYCDSDDERLGFDADHERWAQEWFNEWSASDPPVPSTGPCQTKKITLTNDFHNTEATITPKAITEGRFAGLHMISRDQAKRAWRKLCGIDGCQCGGDFGERGPRPFDVVNEDYDRNFIVRLH